MLDSLPFAPKALAKVYCRPIDQASHVDANVRVDDGGEDTSSSVTLHASFSRIAHLARKK
jgi:hypothetical protein